MKKLIILLFMSFTAIAQVPPEAVRTTDINSICNTKTDTLRNVPESVKHQVYVLANNPGGNHAGICNGEGGCEVDHRISLTVGGTNVIHNLIIQPYFGSCNAHDKDKLEVRLHSLICKNKINVSAAQDFLYNNWQDAYKMYINPKGCQ